MQAGTCLLLRDVVVMRLFLRPIAARLLKCPPFFGIVILMTFVATLRIYGIASRNFINTSMVLTITLLVPCHANYTQYKFLTKTCQLYVLMCR